MSSPTNTGKGSRSRKRRSKSTKGKAPAYDTTTSTCEALGFQAGCVIRTPLGLEATVLGAKDGKLFVRYRGSGIVSPLPYDNPQDLEHFGYRSITTAQYILYQMSQAPRLSPAAGPTPPSVYDLTERARTPLLIPPRPASAPETMLDSSLMSRYSASASADDRQRANRPSRDSQASVRASGSESASLADTVARRRSSSGLLRASASQLPQSSSPSTKSALGSTSQRQLPPVSKPQKLNPLASKSAWG